MSSSPNVIQAMDTVFAASFKKRQTWRSWRTFLAALFALPMDADARAIYKKCTGRDDVPSEQFRECFAIVGRRGGKSAIAAMIATYLAVFRDYSQVLAAGEHGVVMLLAADRRQARVLLNYIHAYFDSIPMLKRLVLSRTQESLTLTNRVQIEVHTTSFRAIRGYTVVAAICDEIAFWRSEDSANPDTEVLGALRPAMATIPNALLLCISSPYARRGALYESYKEFFAKPDAPVLIWKSDTRTMNPTVSRLVIAAAYLRDPAAAAAEYGGEFRTDVEGFLTLDVIETCVIRNRRELPPLSDQSYRAFCDPSGGSSDSFTLAVAHRERDRAVLDLVREVPAPFSPESVVQEFSDTLKRYRISTVTGDRYAGEWPREQFAKRGIQYRPAEKTRSDLYLTLLPMLTSGQAELLDNKRLIAQLVGLERRTSRIGRDSVDHEPGSHDDLSNAAAGALVSVMGGTLVLGLVDMIEQDLAQQKQAQQGNNVIECPYIEANDGCPRCQSCICQRADALGQFWRCGTCQFTWRGPQPRGGHEPLAPKSISPTSAGTAQTTAALRCPLCNYHGIAIRGPEGRCSSCGHQFRLQPFEEPIIGSRRGLEIPDSVNAGLKRNPFSR